MFVFLKVQNSDIFEHKSNPAINYAPVDCSHQIGSWGQAVVFCRLTKCVSVSLSLKNWVRGVWLCLGLDEDRCGAIQSWNNADKWRHISRWGKFMLDPFLSVFLTEFWSVIPLNLQLFLCDQVVVARTLLTLYFYPLILKIITLFILKYTKIPLRNFS